MDQLPTHHVNYVDEHANVHYQADLVLSDILLIGLATHSSFSEGRFMSMFKEALYASNTEAWKRDHLELNLDIDKFSKPHPIPRP